MRTRLETMQRLANLYAAVEEMHSTELQRMTAKVREAHDAIGMEKEAARLARVDGRGALAIGDHVERIAAETQEETAVWRRQALERIRKEREELSETAREQYVASRLRKEQIKRVFDDIATRLQIEEGRRVQAASDDRFLARRRWTDARKTMTGDQQMKVS